MKRPSDGEVYESLRSQVDELQGEDEVCLVTPEGTTDAQYQRVIKRIEEELEMDERAEKGEGRA